MITFTLILTVEVHCIPLARDSYGVQHNPPGYRQHDLFIDFKLISHKVKNITCKTEMAPAEFLIYRSKSNVPHDIILL